MLSKRTAKRLAFGGIGLGLANVALVVFQMTTYEQPNDGGTYLTGLFFFFALVMVAMTIGPAVLGVLLLRRRPPSPWVHRITAASLVFVLGGGLAQMGLYLQTILELDIQFPPTAGFVMLALLVLGVLGVGLGSFVEIGRSVQRKLDAAD